MTHDSHESHNDDGSTAMEIKTGINNANASNTTDAASNNKLTGSNSLKLQIESDVSDEGFTVLPPDPHGFDPDDDGMGCHPS